MEWIPNMLNIDNEMFIFCDEISYEIISKHRSNKKEKTYIQITTFEDFYTYRYFDVFLRQYQSDHERYIGHNPYLYMIWNEKSHFLKLAIEKNPFLSNYFIWCDMGCFREPNIKYINWPNPEKISSIDTNKVVLLEVQKHQFEHYIYSLENLPDFRYTNYISGTIFSGNAEILLKWHDKYYGMLEYFIEKNRFVGKDQSIMNCVYLLNYDMCHLVSAIGKWFHLQDYFNNEDKQDILL
jgi:hypothetical protein